MFPIVDRGDWNIEDTCCLRVTQPITDDESYCLLFMNRQAFERLTEHACFDGDGTGLFYFMSRRFESSHFLHDLSSALHHIEAASE